EHIHNVLSLRLATQQPLGDDVSQKNQRIGGEDQDRSGHDGPKKTDSGKATDQIQIEPAEAKKASDRQEQSNREGAARDEIDVSHSRGAMRGSAGKSQQEKNREQNCDNRLGPAESAGRRDFGIRRTRCDLPQERNINVNAGDEKKRLDHSAERRNEAVDGHAARLRSTERRSSGESRRARFPIAA